MQGLDIVRKLGETLSSTATVQSVFGDPIHAEGRTVIPVARVMYGFGGGFGSGHGQPLRADEAGTAPEGEGGGGGGGALAYPAGALEITALGTRFVPLLDVRWLAGAFGAGVVLGALWRGRRTRRPG